MLRPFLVEGIACYGTWSASRNADGIRTTRVAKGKGKHWRCRRDMLEGKSFGKNEPRTLELGDRMKGENSRAVYPFVNTGRRRILQTSHNGSSNIHLREDETKAKER